MDLVVTGVGWGNQLGIPFFFIFRCFFGAFEGYEYTTKIVHYLETGILKKIPRVNLEAKYRKMRSWNFFSVCFF